MAFNWKTFRTRALTAILFVIVMLAGLLINEWSFLILFSIIHFGCWWEYLRIMEKIHKVKFHPYVKLGMMVLGYGLMLWFCGPVYRLSGYGLKENISLPVTIAGFVLTILGIFQKNKINLKSFIGVGAGLLYISLSWGMLIELRSVNELYPVTFAENIMEGQVSLQVGNPFSLSLTANLIVCITIIITMWINDTMAYIVGSFIGKTPLTKISPKKTWEGTIGGIILAVLVVGLVFSTISRSMNLVRKDAGFPDYFWYVLAAIAAIAGTFGDLLESKLKRLADIKDSGQIMPGHGGFLDRFDSLLLAIPFSWLYVLILFY
jgi:phosphatidate cytidylyltransferase